MNIDGVYLMPRMNSTNSAAEGAAVLNEEASFQNQLKAATQKLEQSSALRQAKIMTDADLAQRKEDIKEASVQLEALLLKMMYTEMWKTVPKNTLFGDDNAMEIYRDMYNDEITKKAAEAGGIGLADYIYRQLTETDPHKLY